MAATKSVTAGSTATSDALTMQTDTVAAYVVCKADNSTTAAADDIIHFKVLEGGFDVDTDSTEDFATVDAAPTLCVLDTDAADPQVSVMIPIAPAAKIKIYADGATEGTTNAITVSAYVREVGVDGAYTDTAIAWT